MPRDIEQLTRHVLMLDVIGRPLMQDTDLAVRELKKSLRRDFHRNPHDLKEFTFWAKAVTSCLFAHITATANVMRKNVQLFHDFSDATPTNREIAKLVERRYDKETDSVSDRRTSPLPTTDSLKLGIKLFARHIGSDFTLNTGDGRFRGLVELQTTRRRFTHPERIEDLYATELSGTPQSSLVWFYSEMQRFYNAAQTALGGTRQPPTAGKNLLKPIKPFKMERQQVFSEEEMKEQIVLAGRSLSYVQQFVRVLRFDGERIAKMQKRPVIRKKLNRLGQFARRIILRTHASQLEAVSNAVWFLLDSARTMREIQFADSDLIIEPGLPSKLGLLIARVNLWSHKLGSRQAITLRDEMKSELAKAWRMRDKLVHPLLPEDIDLKPLEFIQASIALTHLEAKTFALLWVDPDRMLAAYKRGLATRGT